MDNEITYKFDNKNELYKSLGTNQIHNAARVCLINFYETHPETEFIRAEIKILCDEEWFVIIKTLFRCFLEGERDKIIVEALWNKGDYTEPIFTPSCYPEKEKWYRIPYSVLEKMDEKEKKLRAVENELKRLNEEKELVHNEPLENGECKIL
ncbi:hypothetical protein Klosneuvirus_3_30 [Klosneuvirus KNV1]|uniref:Uncharacterized protein n=1 Tax=Klosneuvirus KNV1 TaxID=1977640 RepID=A0A1V0SJK0_9VIRU|nr:hypothetical protein Klosneuvirus_3_30 [Klosneuvirus KNV1]